MRIKSDYILTELAGESIVVAAGAASQNFNGMIRLNPTAAAIWHCLEAEVTEEEIVDKVAAAFDVPPDQAARDVRGFLGELKKGDFLE